MSILYRDNLFGGHEYKCPFLIIIIILTIFQVATFYIFQKYHIESITVSQREVFIISGLRKIYNRDQWVKCLYSHHLIIFINSFEMSDTFHVFFLLNSMSKDICFNFLVQ